MNSDSPLLHGGNINPYADEVVTLPPFFVSESRLPDPLFLAFVVLVVVGFATKWK